jgi:hypothetical protein
MNRTALVLLIGILTTVAGRAQGLPVPQGPFPPDQWPASADSNKVVHFAMVGNALAPLGTSWTGNMRILNDGDQTTAAIRIGGLSGVKATANYLNIADPGYAEWSDDQEIDILMQVYGNGALFTPAGAPRDYNFLIGTLPDLDTPVGGQIPVEAKNQLWNWVLFRIPNSPRKSDGQGRVGSIGPGAQGNTSAGGVNGGTIRLQNVPGIVVRAVAFGKKGAFGEPDQVNRFASSDTCAPEPATNLAWIDLASSQNDHMVLLNDKDQTVTIGTGVGPTGDQRRAARPNGAYMNFAVTTNYLGLPCNEAKNVKICVEFYDDPALAGAKFGPEAFATDSKGGQGTVADDQLQTLAGSGAWERRSWTLPGVNLAGVNVAPLTGGPRLIFQDNAPIFISKFSLGILRTGTNVLADLDPLPDCYSDVDLCKGTYGNVAEMDLATGTLDGLAPGSSGGDQEMIQDEAGPANDRRMAIRPARDDGSPLSAQEYLNFAITDEKLGPTTQPGLQLAICMTYYDDPALVGATFRPEVYMSDRGGTVTFAFPPADLAVKLQGTDKWRDAYFELSDVKLNGVNQGPQAAARFQLSDKIFVSRVRYGVIRPCGPTANVNPLVDCKPTVISLLATHLSDGGVRISWPIAATGFSLEQNDNATSVGWTTVATIPAIQQTENVVIVTPSGRKFYRLKSP